LCFAPVEKQVTQLMMDDDVERKSGIYTYVLEREERHLNIRAFSDNMKREAYEGPAGCRDASVGNPREVERDPFKASRRLYRPGERSPS